MGVACIIGFLRMPYKFRGLLSWHVLPTVVHTRLRAYRHPSGCHIPDFPRGGALSCSRYLDGFHVAYAASYGCFFYPVGFPGMPSLRSCIPGYGVADILPDVMLPVSLRWRTVEVRCHTNMTSVKDVCPTVTGHARA